MLPNVRFWVQPEKKLWEPSGSAATVSIERKFWEIFDHILEVFFLKLFPPIMMLMFQLSEPGA